MKSRFVEGDRVSPKTSRVEMIVIEVLSSKNYKCMWWKNGVKQEDVFPEIFLEEYEEFRGIYTNSLV